MKNVPPSIVAGYLLLTSQVLAADRATNEEIDEITSTGKHLEESLPVELQKYGNRVEIITAEQIKAGGFNDVAQTLQSLVPGLYVSPKNGAFDYIDSSLQGSRNSDILWLLDGVRINNRLYAGTSPLDTIPAHMIERIEVLKGGQGLFYGTQSVAGVVNIITRATSPDTAGRLSLGADTNGGLHMNSFIKFAKGNHQFVLFGSLDKAEGFQPYKDEAFQPSATKRKRGYDVKTLGGKYAYEFSDDLKVTLFYQHTEAKLDYARPTDNFDTYNDRNEELVSAKLDYDMAENVSFLLKTYYHNWDTRYTKLYNDKANPGNILVKYNKAFWGYRDMGVNFLSKFKLHDGLEYFLGYDYQNYNGRDEVLLIGEGSEYVHALFGQVRTTEDMLENTRIAVGLRHNIAKGNDTTTIWNVSGQHNFSDDIYVRSVVGTAFRLPTAYELYAIDTCCTLGNTSLVGEKSFNINMAIGGKTALTIGQFNWEFIGFHRNVDNLISGQPVPGGQKTFANSNKAVDMKGLELILNMQLSEAVSLSFDYTYSHAKKKGTDLQIDGIPEHTIKTSVNYNPENKPFGFGLISNFAGNIYDTAAGQRIEHGNYIILDISGYYFIDADRQHRIGLRLENLLDTTYASRLGTARLDTDSSQRYAYENLGTPRTLHVNYSYNF